MSRPNLRAEKGKAHHAPFVGALLRITFQRVRSRMLAAIHEAGFTDFQEAHFAILSYPPPDGIRPSDLARQRQMTRQAVNYLIVQLEELGYVERRANDGDDRRLVYLTARGWKVGETIFACLRELEAEWAKQTGRDRFAIFMDVLRQLSGTSAKSE